MTAFPTRRLKLICDEPLKYGANAAAQYDDPDWPRFVRISDITESGQLKNDTYRSLPPEIAMGYLLKEGDILLARSGSIGRSFIYKQEWGEVCFAGYLIRARVSKKHDPRFVYWSLNSSNYWSWIESIAMRSTIQNVSAERYAEFHVPLPSVATQHCIADFLDKETDRIDQVIGKKQRLIELLAEKRQALITRAVTRGLDTEVPDKSEDTRASEGDGGIRNIANSSNWQFRRLKNLATYNDEVLAENISGDMEIDYVEISGVSASRGIEEIQRTTFGQAPSRARRKVQKGDILISTVRTYLRAMATVTEISTEMIVSTGFCVIRPASHIDGAFLGWAVQSKPFVYETIKHSVGVSYPAINASELVNINISFPNRATQKAIANFLDRETDRIDQITEKTQQSIDLLSEYRSTLITAAVTGQIDVTNWKMNGATDRRLDQIEEAIEEA
ncbi:MAG: restriction endonuclease subunit S [Paracoccaceae bacterium]|nr:restriction endonuclease subunit S [Paracoccaceae bacterium]MDE2915864.1 restriction endonuclease subunit S [Paracoccaceae bacterium]